MQALINFLNYAATHVPWGTLGQLIGASGLLSTLLLPLKKPVANWFKHNEQVMITLVGVGGIVMAGLHYLLSTPTQNPGIIAVQGFVVAFTSQPFYFMILKPLVRYFSDKIAKAKLLDAQVTTALEPVAKIEPDSTPVVEAPVMAPVAISDVHTFDN